MKNNMYQNEIISSLCAIYEEKCQYIFEDFEKLLKVKEDLDRVRYFFDVDNNTAAVIAVLLCDQISGTKFDVNRCMRYLGFTTINYLEVSANLNELKKKGWLVPARSNYETESINDYYFSKEVMNAIIMNDKTLLDVIIPDNVIKALFHILKFSKNVMSDNDDDYIVDAILQYVENFRIFPIIDSILRNEKLNSSEKAVVFYVMAYTAAGIDEINLDFNLDKFCSDPSFPFVFKNRVASEISVLFKEGFLEFNEPFLADFSSVTLGSQLKDQLEIYKSEEKKVFHPKFMLPILPESIVDKKLFFNEDNQSQINEVFELTSDTYDEIITRFTEQGLQPGLTMLFHGAAKKEKTELVKQIAKQNNRVVLMVDLSLLLNMFIGQSSKNIKSMFSEYRAAVKYYDRTPILLFNEADAIIGKRGVVQNISVDQTFNSVQNMLLQELENFQGIFIATTNLLLNIDNAFDRRMMYKLCFGKPDKTIRLSILKQNFNDIPEDILVKASTDYDLTGGQIDNVKRRCLTEQLLFGTEKSDPAKFISYIEQEMNFRKIDSVI
jgi:hypothetical protein